jgi:hypothetical protein
MSAPLAKQRQRATLCIVCIGLLACRMLGQYLAAVMLREIYHAPPCFLVFAMRATLYGSPVFKHPHLPYRLSFHAQVCMRNSLTPWKLQDKYVYEETLHCKLPWLAGLMLI